MEYCLKRVSIVGVILVILGVSMINAQPICNVTIQDLLTCREAATAPNPPPPTPECCNAIGRADLPCLCRYKGLLPLYGVDPALALQLPGKCGIPNVPQCPIA